MADFDPDAYLGQSSGGGGGFDPDAYLKATAPPPSVPEDVIKGGVSGLAKGVVGLPGIPGNLISLGKSAGDWINSKLYSPEQIAAFEANREKFAKTPPTSGEAVSAVENAAGRRFYQPKTIPGQYAETIGEFAPAAIGGPEAAASRMATRVVAPAVASETAGQITKGTPLEPAARMAGALVTQGPRAVRDIRQTVSKPEINAPTLEELHDAASQGYREARNYGIEIKRQPVARLADDIFSDLHNEGFRKLDAPSAWAKIEELKNPAGKFVTIDDLESVRKALGKVNPINGAEKEVGRKAIEAIDKYTASLDRNAGHIAVNPHFAGAVADTIREARGNWAAMKRGETIEGKLDAANLQAGRAGSGANINNATRQQISQVLRSPKLRRGFSDEELAAMRHVVMGSAGGNIARKIGKLSPEGVVSGTLGIELGHLASGNIAHGLLVPALGKVAKIFGDRSTAKQAERLSQMVRARSPLGRTLPQPSPPPPVSLSPYVGTGLLGQSSADEQPRRAEGGATDEDIPPPLSDEDAALASSMTHYPEVPNPAKPYLDAAGRFAHSGISGVIGHHDPVGDLLQSDAANTALGVMTPLKGAGVAGGVKVPSNYRLFDTVDGGKVSGHQDAFDLAESLAEQAGFVRHGASGSSRSTYWSRPGNDDVLRIADHTSRGAPVGRAAPERTVDARLQSGRETVINRWHDPIEGEIIEHEPMTVVRHSPDEIGDIMRRAIQEYDQKQQGAETAYRSSSPDLLPRSPGRPYDPNRPINPESLRELQALQAELDKMPTPKGRQLNEQSLAEMREIQSSFDKEKLENKSPNIYNPPDRPPRPFEADYPQGAYANASGTLSHDFEGRPLTNPPDRPPRPFEADYPQGAYANASGTLSHDFEGRPLTAPRIVGRRVLGGMDEALQPEEYDALAAATTGAPATMVTPGEMPWAYGSTYVNRFSKRPIGIELRNNLGDKTPLVYSHELGHAIDQLAGQIDTKGLSTELKSVYNTLNNPNRDRATAGLEAASWGKPMTPEGLGYSPDRAPREFIAEAVRAYMTNPNYLKTVAPKTAARIREFANSNPNLMKIIQFNALPIAALGGATVQYQDDRKPFAHGGRIVGAKTQSEVGLSQNETGITFRCGTCKYFDRGKCHNENPELKDRKVKPHWCCNLYDHAGMKVIA